MPPDLRTTPCEAAVTHAEKTLQTTLDPTTEIRKRRSLGYRTARTTWLRLEARDLSRVGQGWGTESAATLPGLGVSMPAWHQGLSWLDAEQHLMWRADETDYVAEPPIKAGGILTEEPNLSPDWWATLHASLDALAAATTTRVATPGLAPITQARIDDVLHRAFPEVQVASGIGAGDWTPAHGDLSWPNLTAPACYLLDWEDFGLAPRGWDLAMLWSESLAVPSLAERLLNDRAVEMNSHSGLVSRLYSCAKLLLAGERSGPLLTPATTWATTLLRELTR